MKYKGVVMRIFALLMLSALISLTVMAGSVTIEKSDSLIRNDLFDKKRERASEKETLSGNNNVHNGGPGQARSAVLEPELGVVIGVTAPFEGLETLVGNSLLSDRKNYCDTNIETKSN